MRAWGTQAAALLLLLGSAGLGAAAPAAGITLRIRQQVEAGEISFAADYTAKFLDEGKFRVEGSKSFTRPEAQQVTVTVAGDGRYVRQLERESDMLRADVLDMTRMRKALPGYDPALTYDPRPYRNLVAGGKAVKTGEAMMDGVKVEQYQAGLPEGRLSLPANVPLGLPDPARVRLWLCPDDGIARRVELEDSDGATFLKATFTEVRSGIPMEEADFRLDFPAAAAPRDITDMMIGLVSASRRPPAER